MKKYATMQAMMRYCGLTLRESIPSRMAAGNATICVTRSAMTRLTVFRPSDVP